MARFVRTDSRILVDVHLNTSNAKCRTRYPSGDEVALVIEVADTSIQKDRSKARIYASAGVKEYWSINLVEFQLEQFTDADGDTYRKCHTPKASDNASKQFDSHSIRMELTEILGGLGEAEYAYG